MGLDIPGLTAAAVWANTTRNLIGAQTPGVIVHANDITEDNDLIITPAALTKYASLFLDMSNLTQNTTIRTYIQVDGTNYRLLDSAVYPTAFVTNAKAVEITLPSTSRTFKITLQSAAPEGIARNIPYFYTKESLA